MRALPLVTALVLAGCPKTAPESPADVTRAMPGPLPTPAFALPATETRTLSNGLEVVVATNSEVPLVDVRLVFEVGTWADPADRGGVAEVTFDLLHDGAADLDAEEISRELKKLGSSLYTGAETDTAWVGASGLVRNLGPTLDLWAKVLTEPTFPDSEWTILQKQKIANVKLGKEDPSVVSRQVIYKLLYGDVYRGRIPSEAGYAAITTGDMKAFYKTWVGPTNARLFVGGDVTADEIVPLLEARIGAWKPTVTDAAPTTPAPAAADPSRLYFVHKAGATQSQLRVMLPVGDRTDPDYYAFLMANEVIGGQFTSRVNMNLREAKGYTYGARCFIGMWDGPGVWGCSTSVQTEVTGAALTELKKEITDALGERPVTAEELAYNTSSQVNGFPAGYETTGSVLDEKAAIWRYGLPADWAERYLPGVQAVTVESANAAFAAHVDPSKLVWVVVGDKDVVWDQVHVLGLEVVELDRDGNPVGGQAHGN